MLYLHACFQQFIVLFLVWFFVTIEITALTYCFILTHYRMHLQCVLLLFPQMSFDPGMLHNNGHTAYANGSGPGIRETGVVEKLLTSYGFIQCSERQARLFFHCSQYNGNLQELKIGGKRPHYFPVLVDQQRTVNKM